MSTIISVWFPSRPRPSEHLALPATRRGAARVLGAFAALAMLPLAVAGPVEAGPLYRWETENGTLAFADDEKRIPDRYRPDARQIAPERLEDYSRFTPTDPGAQQVHSDRLAERLDGLRGQTTDATTEPGAIEIPDRVQPHPIAGIALQSVREQAERRRVNTSDGPRWRRTSQRQTVDAPVPVLDVTPDPDSDAPVVVERVRARGGDSLVTRTVTIVRQGDRVLSVIKPRARHSSSDFPFEEDLEGSR
jgi:hypothetical protein